MRAVLRCTKARPAVDRRGVRPAAPAAGIACSGQRRAVERGAVERRVVRSLGCIDRWACIACGLHGPRTLAELVARIVAEPGGAQAVVTAGGGGKFQSEGD
jgi:hypothetical protein